MALHFDEDFTVFTYPPKTLTPAATKKVVDGPIPAVSDGIIFHL